MRVKLFKITDDSRKVHKTIGEGVEIAAHIYDDMDVLNPSLLLTYTTSVPFDYNYIFIPLTKRYYYINSATLKKGQGVLITCHVDVFKSYDSEIDNLQAYVLRQENKYNAYLPDNLIPLTAKTNYFNKSCGKVVEDYKYYITVNGGAY